MVALIALLQSHARPSSRLRLPSFDFSPLHFADLDNVEIGGRYGVGKKFSHTALLLEFTDAYHCVERGTKLNIPGTLGFGHLESGTECRCALRLDGNGGAERRSRTRAQPVPGPARAYHHADRAGQGGDDGAELAHPGALQHRRPAEPEIRAQGKASAKPPSRSRDRDDGTAQRPAEAQYQLAIVLSVTARRLIADAQFRARSFTGRFNESSGRNDRPSCSACSDT
jgi:hypothetical protein